MGKVKTEQVKRLGKALMARYPEKFGVTFDDNKHAVDQLTQGTTTRIRNKVAGYITRTLALSQDVQSDQDDLLEEEIDV
ncbi:MAG: 30S ribosomal protein S17e [Candidatus Bathyarchaeota archaeon]|nr:30S ribosomal protein S17e [Candidatus Bathyarchaeota archaeon]